MQVNFFIYWGKIAVNFMRIVYLYQNKVRYFFCLGNLCGFILM